MDNAAAQNMTKHLAIWWGHWNFAFCFSLWFEYVQFDACLTIVPIGEHPGIHANLSGGFFRMSCDFYYCDHDHHIPAPEGENVHD